MPLRAVFFDFDGLICDTERAASRSWEELYAELGLTFPDKIWADMTGRSNGEDTAVADLSRQLRRPLDAALRRRRLRRKHMLAQEEPLRPGVAAMTDAALARGITLAVVSSSPLSWVGPHLSRLGIHDRFSLVVTGDKASRHKPAPDLYQLALERLDTDPTTVVAFEDSPSGVKAARAAGLQCIAVPSSVGSQADLQAADTVLDSLEDYVFDAAFTQPDRRVK